MELVKFKECNVVYGEGQKEYLPLPALRFDDGTVVMCWKLSWKELFKVMFRRKIWVSLLTFNHPLQPISVSVDHEDFFTTTKNE